MRRSACVHLDADALRANLRLAKSRVPSSVAWAVIKADAYGHGMVWAAEALHGVSDGFAVSCVEEALLLREHGVLEPLLVLQGPRDFRGWEQCLRWQLQPVVHDASQLVALANLTQPLPGIWLKLDTGMHRLGFPPDQARELHYTLVGSPASNRRIHWLSHLACADEPDHPLNAIQVRAFTEAVRGLPGLWSLANSAAILSGLAASMRAVTWIRPGIMLYGADPFASGGAAQVVTTASGIAGAAAELRPVMTVTAPLIAIKTVPSGDSVGYGATWTAPVATRIGILAIGYADGYPRHAPSGTPVLLQGQLCPLVGRVSMDMIAIDLTTVPEARVGSVATLWGEGLPVTQVAAAAGTISYELLTRVADRLRVVTH